LDKFIQGATGWRGDAVTCGTKYAGDRPAAAKK